MLYYEIEYYAAIKNHTHIVDNYFIRLFLVVEAGLGMSSMFGIVFKIGIKFLSSEITVKIYLQSICN